MLLICTDEKETILEEIYILKSINPDISILHLSLLFPHDPAAFGISPHVMGYRNLSAHQHIIKSCTILVWILEICMNA